MLVIVKLEGNIFDVEDLGEIPSVGEVVSISDEDFVVSGLRLPSSPNNSLGYPILSLLPLVPSA